MPMLNLFAQMMPVLQAREALHSMTVVAMGSGQLKKSEASRIRNEWVQLASLARPLDPATAPPAVTRARIEAMGFRVVE